MPTPNLPASVVEMPVHYLDGQIHYGVSVTVTADDKQSTIMIPDVSKITQGQPVYITGRIGINGKNLKEFLAAKGVNLPQKISDCLKDMTISCDAFYYSKNEITYKNGQPKYDELKKRLGLADAAFVEWLRPFLKSGTTDEYVIDEGPLLIVFSIDFDKGLIGDLSGDPSFSNFFDITSGRIRIVRCMPDKADILKDYVKQLQQST